MIIGCLWVAVGGISCAKDKLNIGHENPELEIQKCIELSNKKNYEKAVECLEIFKSRFPGTPAGQEAELRIADNYFNKKDYLIAADTYQTFIRFHPSHPRLDYAQYRTGISYLKSLPKAIDRDQQNMDEAIDHLEYTIRNFPQSTYLEPAQKALSEAKNRRDRRSFYIGHFYYRTGEYKAAAGRFKEIIEKNDETGLNAEAFYYLVLSYLKLNDTGAAEPVLAQLVARYPESQWRKKAEKKWNRYKN